MTHRGRSVVVLAVALAAGVGSAAARTSGPAVACSCAAERPVPSLLGAHTVVSGRQLDYVQVDRPDPEIERRWLYAVEQRFRGDTGEVIEVRVVTERGDCGDSLTQLPPVLVLGPPDPDGIYEYRGCAYSPSLSELNLYFDQPWPLTGRSPPALIAAAPTADHSLVVLDDHWRPLQYLPSSGPTLGLAICPGSSHLVQLRATGWDDDTAELASWRLDGWSEVSVLPIREIDVNPAMDPITLACLAPDGQSAYIQWDGGLSVSDGTVTPSAGDSDVVSPGPGGLRLVASGDQWTIVAPDVATPVLDVGPAATHASVTAGDDGWRVSAISVFGDEVLGRLIIADIDADGSVTRSGSSVEFPIHPPVAAAIEPGAAASLVVEPGAPPLPLFERTGERVDAAVPTLAPTTVPPTTVAIVQDTDDGASMMMRWIVAGAAAVSLAALLAWALARRRSTRG